MSERINANRELLHRFFEEWNAHRFERAADCVTPDCEFESSIGERPRGNRSVGRQALAAAGARMLDSVADIHWSTVHMFVAGDFAVVEFHMTGHYGADGPLDVFGCDIFSFRDGLISRKSSYRKAKPPVINGMPRVI